MVDESRIQCASSWAALNGLGQGRNSHRGFEPRTLTDVVVKRYLAARAGSDTETMILVQNRLSPV